jgi:hypothetical protein
MKIGRKQIFLPPGDRFCEPSSLSPVGNNERDSDKEACESDTRNLTQ